MNSIRIRSVSRIHITLIDLSGVWGIIDGGAGVILEEPYFMVSVGVSDQDLIHIITSQESCKGVCEEELLRIAGKCLSRIKDYLGSRKGFNILIERLYPPHIGLGSTTQLCMSIGLGVWLLERGEKPDYIELARAVKRGGTSGIGVHGFELGGFIIDGGHLKDIEKKEFLPSDYSKAPPPPLLIRESIPEEWRFILIIPKVLGERIYGSREADIFRTYTPLPEKEAYEVSYHVFMGLLSSIRRKSIKMFRRHLRRIQDIGFKLIEWKIQDPRVIELAEYLDRSGLEYGLSSMGPTIFIPASFEEIPKVLEMLQPFSNEFQIIESKGRNRGAEYSIQ
ncbi:MAG: hypothetical protein QW366_00840 [Sulfolobales archaeon]|jgi:beta-ribofuranosylaminobenzene 5'-phosphate synthase